MTRTSLLLGVTVALVAAATLVGADSGGRLGGALPPTTTLPTLESSSGPAAEGHSSLLWIIIVGFVLAFILAFGVGANDVANVFGTSVGAKVLTLRQACMIATVMEILGSVLIDNILPYSPQLLPFTIVGFVVAFILAFGVGANDVANSFGTSVGSRVLTLRNACILATIFEVLGAILIGYKVSDTVRKGILDVSLYKDNEKELMLGSLAALGGSAMWNLVATFLKLPISGTHTIVGATIGFTLCARGFNGVQWTTFGKIVGSWFVSPVLSGLMSGIIYMGVKRFILQKDKPLEPGLRSLPFFYGFTLFVNVFSIVHDGPSMLMLDNLQWWGALLIAVGIGLGSALIVQCVVVPRQRKSIQAYLAESHLDNEVKFTFGSADNSRCATPPGHSQELSVIEKGMTPTTYTFNGSNGEGNGYVAADVKLNGSASSGGLAHNNSQAPLMNTVNSAKVIAMDESLEVKEEVELDRPEVGKLFSFLQILTATFGSFAHGGNDVSNAIGPLIALWAIYTEGSVDQKSETPIYILLYGGLGIAFGLWIWGRRVIKTIGEDLTKVTPSSGFTIEIGAAFTVLLASKIGLPISTTHCKVGSVVFVGWAKSTKEGVDWRLFRNIVIAWLVTVPLTGGISALLMLIFKVAFL